MLQGIRASTLTVPSFGHSQSLIGAQKMEGYSDLEPWSWNPHQSSSLTQSYPALFDPTFYSSGTTTARLSQRAPPRHHSMPGAHTVNSTPVAHTQTPTPPPPRQQVPGTLVKAQPAFRPTWHGFLETTKDAMTIVEAALQGRLSHISRRPHDKERAEMLTSGTVLVYEENASGIKRWTDAVHWSPSRVMNNCLIYRQLVRALKPEEKRAALNPSCGSKRKRKEGASPAVTNRGDIIHIAEDEYDLSVMNADSEDNTPIESFDKVYANFAQRLTHEQQRRYCGSLIDSYEFKEGGLMKKTISVKYQGTHHHIISYYSLEDVVSGKLKRPFQDPNLADIQPRPELLTGWKVSLDDEEVRDSPVYAGYAQHGDAGHVQHSAPIATTHGLPPQGAQAQNQVQTHTPVNLQVLSEYWSPAGGRVQEFPAPQTMPQGYPPPQHITAPYAQQVSQEYPAKAPPLQQFHPEEPAGPQYPQHPASRQYSQQPSPPNYPPQSSQVQQYSPHATPSNNTTSQYQAPPQLALQYPAVTPAQQFTTPHVTSQYSEPQHAPLAESTQYTSNQTHPFEVPISTPQALAPTQQATRDTFHQQEFNRRASAPVGAQSYGQGVATYEPQTQPHAQYHQNLHPQPFYISGQKFAADQKPQTGGYGY